MEYSIPSYAKRNKVSVLHQMKSDVSCKDKLIQVVSKKKECNAKALQIVEALLEVNIDQNWFLDSLVHINKSHFLDVVEERAIIGLCGYPLCNNKLRNALNQTYKISSVENKVYDITEIKSYCSKLCFRASKFLTDQLHTSPLWLRDCEPLKTFILFNLRGKQNSNEVTRMAPTSKKPVIFYNHLTKDSVDNSLLEDNSMNSGIKENDSRSLILAPNACNKIASNISDKIPNRRHNSSKYILHIISQWFTPATLLFIQEKAHIYGKRLSDYPEEIEKINKRITVLELRSRKVSQSSNPVPDYKKLKKEAEEIQIKVKSFFSGVMSQNIAGNAEKMDGNVQKLPSIHQHNAESIRQRLCLDQMSKVLPDVLAYLGLTKLVHLNRDLQALVFTFSLSATNISLSTTEWTLVTLIVIKLLTHCNEELALACSSKEIQKKFKSLLPNYELADNILEELCVINAD